MVKRALAIVFCVLLLCNCAAAANETKLKIIKPSSERTNSIIPTQQIVSLSDAKNESAKYTNTSNDTKTQQTESKEEEIPSESIGSKMVSSGISLFAKSAIDGMYASFDSNTEINSKFGSVRGALFTVITFVPNSYQDPTIKNLYQNYNNLAIFFVTIFIFGEWANRNLARMKVTSSVFGEKDLSTSKFWGGLCMCGIALCANLFYMFGLQIIQALSQFAMGNVMDSIAPSPENIILYSMMAVCDLVVFVFFVVRYFIIYAVAILCTVLAVLLVPDFSRDFAKKSIDNVIRILLLQPVAIFFTCLGILTMKGLPEGLQPFGYIGLTLLVFLVCWYMLFGDFEFVKKGVNIAVSKGMI